MPVCELLAAAARTHRTVRGTSGDAHGSTVRDNGTDGRRSRGFRTIPEPPFRPAGGAVTRCQWRRYRAHQIILGYRDDSRDVFFIVRGQVRVTFFSEFRPRGVVPRASRPARCSASSPRLTACRAAVGAHSHDGRGEVGEPPLGLAMQARIRDYGSPPAAHPFGTRLSERVVPWPPLVLVPAITLGMVLQPAQTNSAARSARPYSCTKSLAACRGSLPGGTHLAAMILQRLRGRWPEASTHHALRTNG